MRQNKSCIQACYWGKEQEGDLSEWSFLRSIQTETEELQLSDLVEKGEILAPCEKSFWEDRSWINIDTFDFLGVHFSNICQVSFKNTQTAMALTVDIFHTYFPA